MYITTTHPDIFSRNRRVKSHSKTFQNMYKRNNRIDIPIEILIESISIRGISANETEDRQTRNPI